MNNQVVVHKFGGASVRNAEGIRKVGAIIRSEASPMIVVVSAMGKCTNALEQIAERFFHAKGGETDIQQINAFHQEVIADLFEKGHPVANQIAQLFESIAAISTEDISFDEFYDQVVPLGEIASSTILSEYLLKENLNTAWVDAREFIMTDATYREAAIDWFATTEAMKRLVPLVNKKIIITQGFIGRDSSHQTTTLGRDGSDFSAAIFASCMGAKSVTIWKDVPGVMNADPKRLPDALVFEELPFREAAEMTYYGASVIHPKTIKPLANRQIPLWVKSFDNPSLPGTFIHETKVDHLPPLIVFKENQCLVSCRVTDYTFINEEQLGSIFQALSELGIHLNVMQNSAISFTFCVDYREDKVLKLIERLASQFEVYYNTGLTLITIKNYDSKTSQEYRSRPGVVLEQSSRSTLQILMKS